MPCRFLPRLLALGPLLTLGPLPVLPPAAAQEGASGAPAAKDADLRRAWKRLSAEERSEVCEWFRQEVTWLDTFQNRLLRFVLDGQDRDRGTWPAAEPAPFFDPKRHAPEQPIRRKPLSAKSTRVRKQRERLLRRIAEPILRSAWEYDYGTRELVRTGQLEDLERTFENALAGFAPDLDLALALVERQLDDGAQEATLRAFGHAYTDREGRVYTGLTLYDAWASELEIEMPDVDCLGIVHTVLDDWKSWRAPVPARDHDALYARIGELFQTARRHRELRRALAHCYLIGTPVLREGYGASLDELHALWDSASSTPAELRARLPAADGAREFLEEWIERCDDEPELRSTGEERKKVLDADARKVRAALVRVLHAAGALDRDRDR